MTEAVRFYWRGRDASIPLGEIPEPDRNPLRIRRSVVQKYTPQVVKQLEEGQLVAAAWESGGHILLILCHPDLAKGAADTRKPQFPRQEEGLRRSDGVCEWIVFRDRGGTVRRLDTIVHFRTRAQNAKVYGKKVGIQAEE
jgi:hypothetical protein